MSAEEKQAIRNRLHPDIAERVMQIEAASSANPSLLTPAQVRAAFEAARKPLERAPHALDIHDISLETQAATLDARVYTPKEKAGQALPGVAYFHGGGFTNGDLDSHDAICCALAQTAACVVVSVDYRKLPKHPFPAAFDDAVASLEWMQQHAGTLGIDARRLGAAGDSAGANIAVGAALALKDTLPLKALWLAYPFIDLDFNAPSYVENAHAPLLSPARCQRIMQDYFARDLSEADWRLAPLLAESLQGVPPSIVIGAELDPIRSDAERLFERLSPTAPGTRLIQAQGMPHGFMKWLDNSKAIHGIAEDSFLAFKGLLQSN